MDGSGDTSMKLPERYYEKFYQMTEIDAATGYRLWIGPLHRQGYGMSHITHRKMGRGTISSRFAYMIYHELDPDDLAGQVVRHTCTDEDHDYPHELCVDERHLVLGSQRDNIMDAVAADGFGIQKLTFDDAREIRRLYATRKYTQEGLGYRFGVSQSNIHMIVTNKTFKEE
jgi:hypothetical protein